MISKYKRRGNFAAVVLLIFIFIGVALPPNPEQSSTIGIIVLISFFYMLWAYAKAKGHSGLNPTTEQLEGISGWLVIVALGVIVSPFIQVSALVKYQKGIAC